MANILIFNAMDMRAMSSLSILWRLKILYIFGRSQFMASANQPGLFCWRWSSSLIKLPMWNIFFLLRSDSISKGSVWVLSKGKCGVHFVYLVVGIWRGPNTNKQNSTPIYSLKEWTIHGMNLFCLSRILKSPNFTTRNSKKHYPSLCRRKDTQS